MVLAFSRPVCRTTYIARGAVPPIWEETLRSFSTSAGVKYSRVRRSRLDCLRGGIEGEGAARDLGPEAFLLRRPERTFPFWSVGADFSAVDFLEAFAMPQSVTLPFRVLFGNVTDVIKTKTGCWSHLRN
jgi:hypothetical protein